jgi:phosphate starvation-inducible protein PhoH
MTRVGEFSKLFLIGDPTQSDLNGKSISGFKKIYDLFNDDESRKNGIYTFEFTEEDIVRSALVRFIAKKIKNLN